MRLASAFGSVLFLSACAAGQDCACVSQPPPDAFLAGLGIPQSAILMSGGQRLKGGQERNFLQVDLAQVPPAALARLPGRLCPPEAPRLTASRLINPTPDYIERPNSKVVIADCAPIPGETK
ncbi:hypothetical protein GC209_03945 [bacterium]|nr:hypothetical protein [bacterium]